MTWFTKLATSLVVDTMSKSSNEDLGSYTIKSGDTLSQIAQDRNLGTSDLLKANPSIENANSIKAGQNIKIPGTKKEPEMDQFGGNVDTSNSILPINIRQILRPTKDRTNADFSQEEIDAFQKVYEYSQTPEARKAKIDKGYDPNTIQYMDYNAFEGAEAGDSSQGASNTFQFSDLTEPVFNLKTTLGKVSAPKTLEDGSLQFSDIYDFPAKTQSTGARKLGEYFKSVPGAGLNPYRQVRNYMGYYGPQEGDGTGGKINLRIKP